MASTSSERVRAYRARQKALKAMMQPPRMLQLLKSANEPEKPVTLDESPKYDGVTFDSVICDWLTISHPLREVCDPVNDGQILKIKTDGTQEWSSECWKTLKCASGDTSLRIKCDGQTIKMTGNIGRFGQSDNLHGHTVAQCVEMWRKLVCDMFPQVKPADFFGSDFQMVNRHTGEVKYSGTRITRCDLAGNFKTDNFAALTAQLLTHRIGQLMPRVGKYGPTWGYDGKRSNWLRAKVYDKECELEGRRTPSTGATTARFEVQLGSEILKRKGLHVLSGWMKGNDMENVTYLEFSKQVFREQATAENWTDIPPRLRKYAVLWRDGTPIEAQCCRAMAYRVRKALLQYGLDVSQPCNVLTLTRRIEVVKVQPLPARRAA